MTDPSQQDIANADFRAAIAQRQNEAWGRVYAWALGAFGPGWEPHGRHTLIDKLEETAARREGRNPVAEATVYCVKNGIGTKRYFTVEDGRVFEHASMEEAFGSKLTEHHPTLTFEHRGERLPALRYSLCWAAIERYEPMTASELAALRQSRERKRAEREEAAWRETAPLFTSWVERNAAEDGQGGPER